ncbi:MAG: hypothetical protein ABIN94_11005 [Ferruginibacter sp.]
MKKALLKSSLITFIFPIIFIFGGCSKTISDNQPPLTQPPTPVDTRTWKISTVAGNGQEGNLDGADSTSSFKFPLYLSLDASGNIFVGDMFNQVIRKISGHQVTTYFGKNTPGITPVFLGVKGLVVDKQNNIYDIEASFIRKIISSTSSSILAGNLEQTVKDGQDTAARFNEITNLVLGTDNNFYLTDLDLTSKTIIRKVTMSGTVTTLNLKDNTGITSGSINGQMVYYQPMVIDKSGNIYFTANHNSLIKKVDINGNVTVFAGTTQKGTADGKGTSAQFTLITSMTIASDGTIYLIDEEINAVRKVAPDGTVTTLAGRNGPGYVDGDQFIAKFNYPYGITITDAGVLYITDAVNNRIRKMEFK